MPLDAAPALLYARSDTAPRDWSVLDRALSESAVRGIPLLRSTGEPLIELLIGKGPDFDLLLRHVGQRFAAPRTILILADPFKPLLQVPPRLTGTGMEALLLAVAAPVRAQWVAFARAIGDRLVQSGVFMNRGAQLIRGLRDDQVLQSMIVALDRGEVTLRTALRDVKISSELSRDDFDLFEYDSHYGTTTAAPPSADDWWSAVTAPSFDRRYEIASPPPSPIHYEGSRYGGSAGAAPSIDRGEIAVPRPPAFDDEWSGFNGSASAVPSFDDDYDQAAPAPPALDHDWDVGGGSGAEPSLGADITFPVTPVAPNVAGPSSRERTPEFRFLEARFPRKIRIGVASLEARIARNPGVDGSASSVLDPLHIPDKGLAVTLSANGSEGLRVTPSLHTVDVKRGADSKWVLFNVEALRPGVRHIELIAYVDGVQVGGLTVESTVDEMVPTSEPHEFFEAVALARRPAGDATLEIAYDARENTYRYKWIGFDTWLSSDDITHPLKALPGDRVNKLLATINNIARQRAGLSHEAARNLLEGEGLQLWRELIPKQLEEEFFSRAAETKRLMLRPRHDQIPWELLHPPDDGGFLVERFVVSRWSNKRQIPNIIDMRRGEAVVPPRSPQRALDEITTITNLLQPETLIGTPIDSLDVLIRCLKGDEFDLLHFACHHNYSKTAGISFESAMFTPAFLEPRDFTGPMVFLNACRSDDRELTFTGVSGWADKFIERGASAFIGTLWDVRDEPARRFAETFYRQLVAGATLGDAVAQARAAIRDESDPTWLAYTLYGDPGATIRR